MNIEDRNWKEYAQKLEQRVETLIGFINDEELLKQHFEKLKNAKAENDGE